MRCVHTSLLYTGAHGVMVGAGPTTVPVDLPSGNRSIEIWVDADVPHRVSRVAFVLSGDSETMRRLALRAMVREAEDTGLYD